MVQPELLTLLLVLLAYLAGSLPSAVLVCNSMGIADPRQQGSGNPGASNVLRIGNRKAAIITFLLDVGKGVFAVALAKALAFDNHVQGICAITALLGHLFPVFAAFRGGKGVATALGSCLMLYWPLGLLQLLCWGITFMLSKTSSLAAIITALLTPALAWYLVVDIAPYLTLISLLLILRHRRNIQRLLQGNESKF